MKNAASTVLEILVGLNVIKDSIKDTSSTIYVAHKVEAAESIKTALEFIRRVDKRSVLTVENHHSTFVISVDNQRIKNFFDAYAYVANFGIFDGKLTTKVISCKDHKDANLIIPFVLGLADLHLYGGYSYDFSNYSLIAFQ